MKIIIWGHPLGSHTHSYIHYGYEKAFKQILGEDNVIWLDNTHDQNIKLSCVQDLDDIIFFTEGQVDSHIPLIKNAKYVLHNCNTEKYQNFDAQILNLQVYTHDVLKRKVQSISEFDKVHWWEESTKTLYQPWATDLLPNEFNFKDPFKYEGAKKPTWVNWIGTIWDGQFGNINEISRVAYYLQKKGYDFKVYSRVSNEKNRELTLNSMFAPAIQGPWQVEKGYIPCRIFKNISYGQLGVTNNPTVKELIPNCLYSSNIEELCDMAYYAWQKGPQNIILEQMKQIQMHHTYINRANNILSALGRI